MARKYNSPVALEPIEHVYIHKKTGAKFTSVTKIISLIEPHFEAENIAEAISNQSPSKRNPKYIGLSKSDILDMWQRENDEANMYGTMVHEILEDYLMSNKFYFPKNDFEKAVIAAYDELHIDEGREIYPERIMFSEEYKLAGTTDILIDIDDELFDIGDFKTNKVLNYYSKYGTWLLPPFNYMEDCQYAVYTLQLSLYALMYEMEMGKKCRQLYLMHFNKEFLKFQKIPVIYMKNEALKLMKIHKYNEDLAAV